MAKRKSGSAWEVPVESGSFSPLPVPHNGEQLQRGCLVSWEIWCFSLLGVNYNRESLRGLEGLSLCVCGRGGNGGQNASFDLERASSANL